MAAGGKPIPHPVRSRSSRSQLPVQVGRHLRDGLHVGAATVGRFLRLDVPIVIFSCVFLALFAPLLPRNADNPQLLAAYANDEPFLTMALEAMLEPPYGNPGTYFDPQRTGSVEIPEHWGEMSYPHITYYGGAMFQLAFVPYATFRALGAPPFPTGPVVLRTLTLLAGLLSLIVLYNIGKQRGSRLAGLLAAVFVASDPSFLYYATYLHPDTLQMFFGLCAFLLAIRHGRDGGTASLVALGVFCGLVHGTKSGGAWTIPMVALAIWLGARAPGVAGAWGLASRLGRRALVVTGAALGGFFVSTPYAFFDTYYLRSMRIALSTVTGGTQPLGEISLLTWTEALYDYVGPLGATLVAATAARALWLIWQRRFDPALTLALVLALSQFLWYGGAGRLWHVPGYLILSFGLIAIFAFETVFVALRSTLEAAQRVRPQSARALGIAWVVAVSLLAAVLAANRWYTPVSWAVDQHTLGHSTVRAANEWAIDHRVRSDAVIVYDDLAYFDRQRFPRADLHGGVLTWPAVDAADPDYMVLSESLFGAAWMQRLIATQELPRRDPDPFNVRVYQDLLPTTARGPTSVPGIELAGVVRSSEASVSRRESRLAGLASACRGAALCELGIVDLGVELTRAADVERRLRALADPGTEPLIGPELRIFHVRRPGTPTS